MSLESLWKRLLKIKKINLKAESLQPVWRGNAQGQVVLSEIGENSFIFTESGEWDFAEKPKVKFFNIYLWEKNKNETLKLSHLRNGKDAPVHLHDFKQIAENQWKSNAPHVCREDLYTAVLLIEKDMIQLNWKIKGPSKNQNVKSIYF